MSMFGEIKCGRCDRRYSAARAKCPYCGARKGRSGRRVDTTDSNSRAKVIVGLILLLLIIVAVVMVIVISLKGGDKTPTGGDVNTTPPVNTSDSPDPSGGINSVENDPLPSHSVEPSAEPSVEPSPVVQDIILNRSDITMSRVGETWNLLETLVPADIEATITWTSSDESVALVDLEGKVTAISNGMCTITASADGVSKECIVRVSV